MSLVTIVDPVGIDILIASIQDRSFNNLITNGVGDWTDANYESYARAYVNPKKEGTIPEVYTGDREYKEVLMDDTFVASSFFLVDDSRVFDESQFTLSISIIYQADIQKLFPSILHRADEEMHKDIIDSLEDTEFTDFITDITTGIDGVYSDLDIPDSYLSGISLDDMSNYHVVKIDLEVPYGYCNP